MSNIEDFIYTKDGFKIEHPMGMEEGGGISFDFEVPDTQNCEMKCDVALYNADKTQQIVFHKVNAKALFKMVIVNDTELSEQ